MSFTPRKTVRPLLATDMAYGNQLEHIATRTRVPFMGIGEVPNFDQTSNGLATATYMTDAMQQMPSIVEKPNSVGWTKPK